MSAPQVLADSTFSSVIKCTCPKCRKAYLFKYRNHYSLSHLFDMPRNCPMCGQSFEIEPGFYLGAMWMSYPVIILLEVIFILLLYQVLNDVIVAFLVSTFLIILLSPPIMRLARSMYIHLFVHYEK